MDKRKGARSRLSATFGGKGGGDKEAIRQCFLFSNHLLLTTRQSDDDGRLNLVPHIGKIPLSDAVLVEDPNDQAAMDDDGITILLLFKLTLLAALYGKSTLPLSAVFICLYLVQRFGISV